VPLVVAIEGWYLTMEHRKSGKALKSKVKLVKGVCAGLPLTRSGIVEAAENVLDMVGVREEGKKLTAATINRRLAVLKGTAKWAWKVKHWTAENLSPFVVMLDKGLERVRRRTVDQKAVERLIRHAPNFEAKAFIALGAYGLMRQGEIMAAKREDIHRAFLALPETKNGPRTVPITAQLRPYLKAIPFESHARTLYGWFEEARDAAGIADLVHHDLRRSGATILLNSGHASLEVVAHILGDSLDVARKHYAHVLNRTAEKAMRKGFGPHQKSHRAKRRAAVSA
jgi:integrase